MELPNLPAENIQQIADSLSVDAILTLCGDIEVAGKLCDGPFLRKLAKKYLTDWDLNEEDTNELMDNFRKIIGYESQMFGSKMYLDLTRLILKLHLPLVDPAELDYEIVDAIPTFPKLRIETWYSYNYFTAYTARYSIKDRDKMGAVYDWVLTNIDATMVTYIDLLVNYGYEKRLVGYLQWITPQIYSYPIWISIKNGLYRGDRMKVNDGLQPYDEETTLSVDYVWAITPLQYALYLTKRHSIEYLSDLIKKQLGPLLKEDREKNVADPSDALDFAVSLDQLLMATEDYFIDTS